MYCIKCGVKLADTEKKCPLCNTVVYHPEISQPEVRPLYPQNKFPKIKPKSKVFNGAIIILFLIPMLVSLISDWQNDKTLNWFGFVAGGLVLGYLVFGLPNWFHKPNPVIFVPCSFAALIVYLLYINLVTNGDWFLSFAFPVAGALGLIVTAAVTLLYYLKKGRLYILGGTLIAVGGFILLVEFLLNITFKIAFIGWSIYPLIVFALLGGLLIYLAINTTAREIMERKLFF
ncbi:MAG: hypothetical protein E7545_02425 [Ruminococcaceae bacterium]|nr:hypothetical protein [Oscillospiraceae bacterium]